MRWKTAGTVVVFATAAAVAVAVLDPSYPFAVLRTASDSVWPKPDLAPTPVHEAMLAKYKEILKPGVTRKEVEDHLRDEKAAFFRSCCSQPSGAFSTMVRIGDRPKPWFCSSWGIYVAFEFTSSKPDRDPLLRPSDADVLSDVLLSGRGESCL